jgi:flagellar hook-associated protein 3 FlgL
MRISSNMLYSNNTDSMTNLQSSIVKLQQEVTSGRVLTPADDPIASARALDLTQSQSINAQFATNRQNASSALTQSDSSLSSIITAITDVKSQAITAGNAAYSNSDRGNIATALQGTFQELLGYANTTDGLGNYVYAGYKSTTQPFVATGTTGVTYNGDQGVQTLQVDTTRTMNVSVSGQAVFQGQGADIFKTIGNLITALQTPVTEAGNNAEAALSQTAYNTAYGQNITGLPTPTAAQITAAEAAATPAQLSAADLYAQQQQQIYDTDYANRTDYPAGSTGALNQVLAKAGKAIDQALNNVSTAQASVGASMNELSALDSAGSAKDIQYTSTISQLMGTSPEDMTKTVSELAQQQTYLQVAQKTFATVSGLSLLNFIK